MEYLLLLLFAELLELLFRTLLPVTREVWLQHLPVLHLENGCKEGGQTVRESK